MSINAKMTVADISALADRVLSNAHTLEGTSNSVRQSVTRADEFQGTAANNYDAFLEEWSVHQAKMIEAMHGAANLLKTFAQRLDEIDDGAFNMS